MDSGEDDYIKTLMLSPDLYYFVIHNFAIGGALTYINTSQGDYSSSMIGIGPGAKFCLNAGDMKMFISASLSYSSLSSKINDYKYKTTEITFGGNLDFFLCRNLSLEPILRYHIIKNKSGEEERPGRNQLELGN